MIKSNEIDREIYFVLFFYCFELVLILGQRKLIRVYAIRVWLSFFVSMAYQPSWVIQCQSHPCRRTVVVLFNP